MTTAGLAIVIVAVCVAVVSATVQLGALNICFTNAVVANCVLFAAGGGVIARLTVATVWVPDPALDVATNGESVGDVETLNVVPLIFDT